MVFFEDWAIKPFSQTNREPESAINLAQLNWQGSDKFQSVLVRNPKQHITVLFLNYQTFVFFIFDESRLILKIHS